MKLYDEYYKVTFETDGVKFETKIEKFEDVLYRVAKLKKQGVEKLEVFEIKKIF